MSNNRDVTYKGDCYFFTYEKTQKVKDIETNASVVLNYEGSDGMYISVSGKAKLIRNKSSYAGHWDESLKNWFKNGINTRGLVLIHVKGSRLRYWQKEKEGVISLAKK